MCIHPAQVEQERFVVKPFTLGLHSSPAHDDPAAADDTVDASDKLINRSTTGILRGWDGLSIPAWSRDAVCPWCSCSNAVPVSLQQQQQSVRRPALVRYSRIWLGVRWTPGIA